MSKLYVIKRMGKGFDGLIVEAIPFKFGDNTVLAEVRKIINRNSIFGDRNVAFPVEPNSLFVDLDKCEEYMEEQREFDSKNPFGEFKFEGRYTRNNLEVVFGQYTKALQVTVYETTHEDGKYNDTRGRDIKRTLYSQNFMGNFTAVKEAIEHHTSNGDVDDLVFRLNELKEMEAHG